MNLRILLEALPRVDLERIYLLVQGPIDYFAYLFKTKYFFIIFSRSTFVSHKNCNIYFWSDPIKVAFQMLCLILS